MEMNDCWHQFVRLGYFAFTIRASRKQYEMHVERRSREDKEQVVTSNKFDILLQIAFLLYDDIISH